MKLTRVLNELYCRPWLITPTMHRQICNIVDAHVDGSAHAEGGIIDALEVPEARDILGYYKDVAVVDVQGVIARKVGGIEKSSGVTDVNDIADALQFAAEDESTAGIVMRIDSPGGTVTGVPELAMLIREIGMEKVIVSYVDGMAASAGYWIASQAHGIVTGQSSSIGSVGVYMALLDTKLAMEQQGMKMEVIKAGKYKGIGIQGTSLTDEQRALLQSEVDSIHEMFKGAVKIGRGNVSDELMQGQDFMGGDAVQLGLADVLGTMDEAVDLVHLIQEKSK